MNTSPYCTQLELSPNIDAASIFSVVAHENGAMFLDSANAQHQNSRYDILLCQPLATLRYQMGKTQIKLLNGGYLSESSEDPFRAARRLHKELMPIDKLASNDLSHLPFAGGTVGWFSYDLGRSIEKLPEIALADIQLPDMYIGIFDFALIKDNQNKQWYALDYQPELKRIENWLNRYQQATTKDNRFCLLTEWQSNMSKTAYQDKFNQVKHYLRSGDCYQINLAQRFSAEYSGCTWQAYLNLRAKNKAPFSAFIQQGHHSVLSISPERFLQVQGQRVETKPIKGTLARGQSVQQDQQQIDKLKGSAKDRAENLMIVDLLRNDISKVCAAGTVKVPKLFDVESFPAVHHLVSTVTGELNQGKNAFDLLKACFPGGSITGAPKVRAMEIIEELEPHRRTIYCGAIGFIDWRGNMDTNIAIRTLVADSQQIHCWAGGGLVYDSKCAHEYKETFDKVSKILPVLSEQLQQA
ncbi:para-aminobenzoate synthase, component I [Catenovulum agarivorans DS-2]|uniref:aminodeoxychorismate synthase n=1 Tax=Catenovulum agarivorans DS-2 TaxID=1328313 RepID=W7QWN2_9ALTE|nr:aminodeoxychorismate synthase component I [Catenovulum agarivorans]EWH12148.1 para-aminobenzoate synthase, component I [Catenovulum agarivorans DS-2]